MDKVFRGKANQRTQTRILDKLDEIIDWINKQDESPPFSKIIDDAMQNIHKQRRKYERENDGLVR